MISGEDFYNVMAAVVPLYVAMILAYGSVRWWGLLSPDQCSGINRFVALFAVPLLSFQIISKNNPYEMDPQFIAADAMQKGLVLAVLTAWCRWDTRRATFEWVITHFMVATLPNTLVMGIPLLGAMYGKHGALVVQAVVLQCIVWYTLLLILYEYRAAKLLILEQFPAGTAASIVSFKVDSDVISLDGREGAVMTEAEVGGDGRIHVKVRRSTSSAPRFSSASSVQMQLMNSSQNPHLFHQNHLQMPQQYGGAILRSPMASMFSSKAGTPRPSNLTGAEIYSLQSSRNMTPRESNFGRGDLYLMGGGGGSGAATMFAPRHSNVTTGLENGAMASGTGDHALGAYSPSPAMQLPKKVSTTTGNAGATAAGGRASDYDARELHMFVWSSSASPTSERGGVHVFGGTDDGVGKADGTKESTKLVVVADDAHGDDSSRDHRVEFMQPEQQPQQDFSFPGSERADDKLVEPGSNKHDASSTEITTPKIHQVNGGLEGLNLNNGSDNGALPPASVMTRLILSMVWRKLIRNPNTYSSVIGLVWALISFRWNIKAPKIIEKSITILSDAGLGMAMFSLGLFMALQSRLLACGTSMALFGMLLRFFCGPAIMSVTSIATGLRSLDLRASIVQAALPSGIVPFVFAKEYNVHPDVLSTAVIFGMLVALPITLIYYVLLGI